MYGPGVNNDTFHVFWYDDYYSDYIDDEYTYICDLDVDDTSSYGPETITISRLNNTGKYSYYVHDFTNKNESNSKELSNSGAIAKVYSGNVLIATFNVPTNKIGTVWHVFDYNAGTDKIEPINEFYSQSNCDYVNERE